MRTRDGGIDIAGCDDLLESKAVEVEHKVLEEVAFKWVVAVAEDGLVPKMVAVVAQLLLYVRQLSVELILLRLSCGVQSGILVCHISIFLL